MQTIDMCCVMPFVVQVIYFVFLSSLWFRPALTSERRFGHNENIYSSALINYWWNVFTLFINTGLSDYEVRMSLACHYEKGLWSYLFVVSSHRIDPNVSVQLLECDKHFEQYESDFPFYDYNQPEDCQLKWSMLTKVIVADPPYLVRA